MILDPVNLLDISNYKRQESIFEEAFTLLNDYIDVLHIKDFVCTGESLKTTDLSVGDGELALSQILSYAKAKKPCIDILIEDSNPSNIKRSKEAIEKLYMSL